MPKKKASSPKDELIFNAFNLILALRRKSFLSFLLGSALLEPFFEPIIEAARKEQVDFYNQYLRKTEPPVELVKDENKKEQWLH